jgi:predicted amidohydrolase YtcJ
MKKNKNIKKWVLALCVIAGVFALWLALPEDKTVKADAVYFNGKIITVNSKMPAAEAVAVKDGKFLAVGDADAIKKFVGRSTKQIDLNGKTVVPGLIDGHTHPVEAVRMKEKWVDTRFPGTPSVKQALENIAARVKTTPKGAWIFAAGSSSSENKFVEKRLPEKSELDGIAPENPVIFLNGTHEAVANTLALQKMGVTKDATRLKHGGIAITDSKGEPTGDLIEAEGDVPDFPTEAELVRYFSKDIPELWNQNGFTSVLGITNAQTLSALNKVAASGTGSHSLRYTAPVWTDPAGKLLPEDLTTLGISKSADPAWYRTGGIKVWTDGEPDARTGAVYASYCGHFPGDFPGGKGILNTPQERANEIAAKVDGAGLMNLFHCSADHSTDVGLNAYENLLKSGPRKNILRIEHFGVFMLTDEQLKRAVDMDIKVSVQPVWLANLAKANYENLGKERADSSFRFRTMIDAGLQPSGGTDVTGIYLVNLDPFLHMGASVTRESDMGIFHPEEAVTPFEALKMWTIWAAKAMGEESLKGSIEPGKYADMTVISDNLLTIPKEKIKGIKALKTIVDGNIVYEAK